MQRIGWLAGNRRRFRHASPIAFDPRRTIDIFDGQFAWLPFRFSVGKRTGTAELSDPGGPTDVKVDTVAAGFSVVESRHGINFYWTSCDGPAEL
jgi:hypothetical protein